MWRFLQLHTQKLLFSFSWKKESELYSGQDWINFREPVVLTIHRKREKEVTHSTAWASQWSDFWIKAASSSALMELSCVRTWEHETHWPATTDQDCFSSQVSGERTHMLWNLTPCTHSEKTWGEFLPDIESLHPAYWYHYPISRIPWFVDQGGAKDSGTSQTARRMISWFQEAMKVPCKVVTLRSWLGMKKQQTVQRPDDDARPFRIIQLKVTEWL
jgi:hypothetical protein